MRGYFSVSVISKLPYIDEETKKTLLAFFKAEEVILIQENTSGLMEFLSVDDCNYKFRFEMWNSSTRASVYSHDQKRIAYVGGGACQKTEKVVHKIDDRNELILRSTTGISYEEWVKPYKQFKEWLLTQRRLGISDLLLADCEPVRVVKFDFAFQLFEEERLFKKSLIDLANGRNIEVYVEKSGQWFHLFQQVPYFAMIQQMREGDRELIERHLVPE